MTPEPIKEIDSHIVFMWSVRDFEENEDHYCKPGNVGALAAMLRYAIKQLRREGVI